MPSFNISVHQRIQQSDKAIFRMGENNLNHISEKGDYLEYIKHSYIPKTTIKNLMKYKQRN